MPGMIFEAISLGLTLSILIGPVFFALIQTSIKRGFKSGMAFAVGIFLSDFTCILLAYLGMSQFINDPTYYKWIGIIGGIFLIFLGLYDFFSKDKEIIPSNDEIEENTFLNNIEKKPDHKLLRNFAKAYLLNIITPSVLLFWIFWVGIVTAKYAKDTVSIPFFFLITLLTVLCADTLKVYLANQLKQYLKPSIIHLVKQIAGVILVIFGIYLAYKSLNGETLF